MAKHESSSDRHVRLPLWDSRENPDGWADLRDRLIAEYIDAIEVLSLYDLLHGKVSEEDQTKYQKEIMILPRKLCRAIASCIVEGTPADNLMR